MSWNDYTIKSLDNEATRNTSLVSKTTSYIALKTHAHCIHTTFRKLLLYVHLRKIVAFETSCVCSVVYVFKTMENVFFSDWWFVTYKMMANRCILKRILGKHYTDKWIGFIWLLICYNNDSFWKRQCGEISCSAEQLLLVKVHDQRCQLATRRLCQSVKPSVNDYWNFSTWHTGCSSYCTSKHFLSGTKVSVNVYFTFYGLLRDGDTDSGFIMADSKVIHKHWSGQT